MPRRPAQKPDSFRSLNHWKARWKRKIIDPFTNDVLKPHQGRHGKMIRGRLQAKSCVEFGCGCFTFLRYLHQLNIKKLAGIELDIDRIKEMKPDYVDGFFSNDSYVYPWKDKEFDVSYQYNAIANVESNKIPLIISELCRISKYLVYGRGLFPRFKQGDVAYYDFSSEWMLDELRKHGKLILVQYDALIWRLF